MILGYTDYLAGLMKTILFLNAKSRKEYQYVFDLFFISPSPFLIFPLSWLLGLSYAFARSVTMQKTNKTITKYQYISALLNNKISPWVHCISNLLRKNC
jgi:hypothetical protein